MKRSACARICAALAAARDKQPTATLCWQLALTAGAKSSCRPASTAESAASVLTGHAKARRWQLNKACLRDWTPPGRLRQRQELARRHEGTECPAGREVCQLQLSWTPCSAQPAAQRSASTRSALTLARRGRLQNSRIQRTNSQVSEGSTWSTNTLTMLHAAQGEDQRGVQAFSGRCFGHIGA